MDETRMALSKQQQLSAAMLKMQKMHSGGIVASKISAGNLRIDHRGMKPTSVRHFMATSHQHIGTREDLRDFVDAGHDLLSQSVQLINETLDLLDENASEIDNPVLDEAVFKLRNRLKRWIS